VNRWHLGLVGVLGLALGLRLWGVYHGLPFVYNADERAHFVPKAIKFFRGDYNPHYFRNPPGFTYLVHALLRVRLVGQDAAAALKADPRTAYELGRLASAALGVLAAWLVYLLGTRLFDRRVGLLAAAVMATAFLPVFYSHLALNDVPATVPLTLSLFGSAGVLLRGRRIDWALAGAGLGLGAATKYTAGIALVPLLTAAVYQLLPKETRREAVRGGLLAALVAMTAFFVANPYAFVDPDIFLHQLRSQGALTAMPKVGQPDETGYQYYLWVLTWGLGWAPMLAAAAGGALLAFADRRLAVFLLPAPLLFYLYVGSQERFFGRWLLPIFPILCVLAAYAVVRAADAAARRGRGLSVAVGIAGTAVLVAQGLVYAVHNDLVLTRTDTRTLARAWMIENIPRGSQIVLEPGMPKPWIRARGAKRTPYWDLNPRSFGGDGYVLRLWPALLDSYLRTKTCWVVTASTIRDRAFADPELAAPALRYYRELDRRGTVVYRAVPWRSRVGFDFDWPFDWYPLRYERPGPEMTVYRLHGGSCA
jgi:Dolichyl-phosphate-mannose-protein mannosyltransferase